MTSVISNFDHDMASTSDKEIPTTGCYDALTEMLQTFEERDIKNFLFTEERIEVPYFRSPDFRRSAVTVSLSSKLFGDGVMDHVQGYMVYTPAFSVANRILGFGYHAHSSAERATMQSTGRFVHDCVKGTFTTILQNPADGRVVITYKKYLSTTCHTRFTAYFDLEQFQACLHNNSLSPECLLGALKQLQTGLESRECSNCGRGQCDCVLGTYNAKHPFDDGVFKYWIGLLMGEFKGFAMIQTFRGGVSVSSVHVGCEIKLLEVGDEEVTERLRRQVLGDVGLHEDRETEGELGNGVDVRDVWKAVDQGLRVETGPPMRRRRREESEVVSELKAALRRERNRASARKSNMKKKAVNDALKAAVKDEQRRLEGLRSRELELRRRNLELRKLLSDIGKRNM